MFDAFDPRLSLHVYCAGKVQILLYFVFLLILVFEKHKMSLIVARLNNDLRSPAISMILANMSARAGLRTAERHQENHSTNRPKPQAGVHWWKRLIDIM